MKNFYRIARINLIAAITLSLALASFAANNNNLKTSAKGVSAIAENLAGKLKADLAENNLTVRFGKMAETKLSAGTIEIQGEAFCVLPADKTELPLKFTAKINAAKQTVADVQYAFVESSYAPALEEEVLMTELIKQISADYKTDQITIAIDGFETLNASNNQKNLKGIGEVKIGEVEWNKISFDVVLGADKKAARITYSIK